MSEAQTGTIHASKAASIGDEIPYRRSQMDQRTGSLVFDKHLEDKLAESPEQTPTDVQNPLKRGQVT